MGTSSRKWFIIPESEVKYPMFMGESQHSLDVKSRVTVPARFREDLGNCFVATKGLDHCIFLFPLNEWKEVEAKVRQLPMTNSRARSFIRFFFSGAVELEMDKQGRVLLPLNLREYAAIEKDVCIIGVDRRVEIWAAEAWMNYSDEADHNFEESAETLADLGI